MSESRQQARRYSRGVDLSESGSSGSAGVGTAARQLWADVPIEEQGVLQLNYSGRGKEEAKHQIWGPIEVSSSRSKEDSDSSFKHERLELINASLHGVTIHSQSQSQSNSDQSQFDGSRDNSGGKDRQQRKENGCISSDMPRAAETHAHNMWGLQKDSETISIGAYEASEDKSQATSSNIVYSKSRGSELHADGQCHPCRFMLTKRGCSIGSDCTVCHLEHAPSQVKMSKEKRARCKRYAEKRANNQQDQSSDDNGPVLESAKDIQDMQQDRATSSRQANARGVRGNNKTSLFAALGGRPESTKVSL